MAKPYTVNTELLLDQTNEDQAKIKSMWKTLPKFFTSIEEKEEQTKLHSGIKIKEDTLRIAKPTAPENIKKLLTSIETVKPKHTENMHFEVPSSLLLANQIDIALLYELPEELRTEILSMHDFSSAKTEEETAEPSTADLVSIFAKGHEESKVN